MYCCLCVLIWHESTCSSSLFWCAYVWMPQTWHKYVYMYLSADVVCALLHSVQQGDVLLALDGKMVMGKSVAEAQDLVSKAQTMQLLRKAAVSFQYTAYRTPPHEKREAFQNISQAALNVGVPRGTVMSA